MNCFSFRAECQVDVDRLRDILSKLGLNIFMVKPTKTPPDVHVELMSVLDQEMIEEALRSIADSHVMIQTLRPVPLAQNSLERDFNRV